MSPTETIGMRLWEEAQATPYSEAGQSLSTLFPPRLYEDVNIFATASANQCLVWGSYLWVKHCTQPWD